MSALPIRDQLLQELNALSDEQIITVLEFVHALKADSGSNVPDTENDPLVGFFSGPSDLAERSQEILRAEFGIPKSYDTDSK
ncbi:MAG: hypothetical protein ABI690_00820 [Chloroflexota bacterium]